MAVFSKPYPPSLGSASTNTLTLRWDDCGVADASYCIQSEGEFGRPIHVAPPFKLRLTLAPSPFRVDALV